MAFCYNPTQHILYSYFTHILLHFGDYRYKHALHTTDQWLLYLVISIAILVLILT